MSAHSSPPEFPAPGGGIRIVSLLASATEIIYELGLGAYLAGRSHECDYPPQVQKLPCVTRPRFDVSGSSRDIDTLVKNTLAGDISVYEVFDDVLEALQPTHIVTQIQCDVCAVSLRDVERSVARKLKSRPKVVALNPNSLADIWDDMRRVGESVGMDAGPAIQRLQDRMQAIAADLPRGTQPAMACIEWLEPLMAGGNWVPELIEMAGGRNLFGTAGKHSPWMQWDDLRAADPDILIAMPCGFGIARTLDEMYWLTRRPGYEELRAVRNGRVYVADGNEFFNRPGPRVVESLEILAEIVAEFRSGVSGRGRLEHTGYVRYSNAPRQATLKPQR